ncbi:MAG: ATP-dependent RNA helicase RhlE, partial [Cyclobacteriaceae bacterium]
MAHFETLNLSNALRNAVEDLGFENPTPIQEAAFPLVLSGRDMVGIAQTGTGKTFAYLLPLLNNLKFSNQPNPRVLILVPTRELVLQVVEQAELLTKYMSVRVMGIYGGTNIKMQRVAVADGMDVLVATPGRLYDLVLSRSIELKAVKKLVIDEVDVMLDLGFRFQITNFFELLPEKKQSIMFSATMTEDVEILIDDYFIAPEKIYIALSGTPLANIKQSAYAVPNFYTKANLVIDLVSNKSKFHKVLIFVPNKRSADRLFGVMQEIYDNDLCIIHSNKTQNYRIRSLRQFNVGAKRIMIATDVIARGLDLDKISHVINFDVPIYPENYMHRIGRTGRAE